MSKTAKTPVFSQQEIDELTDAMWKLKKGLMLKTNLDFSKAKHLKKQLRAQFAFLEAVADVLVTVGGDLDARTVPNQLYTSAENARGAAEEVSEFIDSYVDLASALLIGGDAVLAYMRTPKQAEPTKPAKASAKMVKPVKQADDDTAALVAKLREEIAELRSMVAKVQTKA